MMGFLSGKKLAIVGNGPSGNNQGAEIDACDFVVRQKRWISYGPPKAGLKVSAICGFGVDVEIPPRLLDRRDWEIWCNMSPSCFRSDPTDQDPGDWRWLLRAADGRVIRTLRETTLDETVTYLRQISNYDKPPYLTLGLACLAMAIDLGAEHIELWGYDRTGIGRDGDNWAQHQYDDNNDQLHHDYLAQKIMIAELADRGQWCGRPSSCKLIWHGRPALPGYDKKKEGVDAKSQ